VIRAIRDKFDRSPLLAKRFNQNFLHKAFTVHMPAQNACHAVTFEHCMNNVRPIAVPLSAARKPK
jgi:hypothetical protein